MALKIFFLTLLLTGSTSVNAQQFFASAAVADTVTSTETLPALLQQRDTEDAQLELEYRSAQIVKQLENSASLPQLLQRLQFLQAFSAAQPAVQEFLQVDVFELAYARWQELDLSPLSRSMPDCTANQTRCTNIAFLRHNPFVFAALAQLPRAYTYVNAVLPLAAPRAAALAVFDLKHATQVLFSITEPRDFFSSLALLRRVLLYYGQPLHEFEASVAQHSQLLLRRTQITQATLLVLTTATSWKAGLKKLLRKQKLPKRMLPLLLPLYLSYLITEQAFAEQRSKWQQARHYSDQMLLYLVQEK